MPTTPEQVCLLGICTSSSTWTIALQGIGAAAAILFGTFGLIKLLRELNRINEQRAKELEDKENSALLKRTEFFLDQHRRLFDDEILYEVLCLIDGDDKKLREQEMWDKKRKLLTFFEEIALLVNSKQINADVAYYMFGYYATCARMGKNFAYGINMQNQHWRLFFAFSDKAKDYLSKNQYNSKPLSL